MSSNRSALDALAQEGILMTEEQLLRETQKVRSNGNGSIPALAKGQMANNNGTRPSMTAVKAKPGSGPTHVGEARSLPAAEIALDQQPGIAIAPDQPAMDTPAVLRQPTDIPRDSGFLVGPLATIGAIAGAIAGAILLNAATGDGDAFFGGAFLGVCGGAVVGVVIGWIISDLLWRIGLHVEEADCSGCGRELEPTLFVCPGCATPVKYQWGKAPVELTPSDHVLLDMVPRKSKEENGRSWVEVEVPSGVSTNRFDRVLATALLANEEAGAIRLEKAKGNLVAITTDNNCQVPGGCLESDLCKAGPVYNTVFDWIGTTSYAPEADAVKRIMGSMAKRMLLEPDKKRVLNLFTMVSSRYVVPKRTSDRLMERSVRLIEECRRARPDIHDHLEKAIARAFAARTEEPAAD